MGGYGKVVVGEKKEGCGQQKTSGGLSGIRPEAGDMGVAFIGSISVRERLLGAKSGFGQVLCFLLRGRCHRTGC